MTAPALTIGRLAKAAGVGIETIRYYQRRQLLPVPPQRGAFRHYPPAAVARIHFIKRAQELGFSLDEIAQLLQLADGAERDAVRAIARQRLDQIEAKLADLGRMKAVLSQLIDDCEHCVGEMPCPIIDAFLSSEAGNLTLDV